MNSLKVILNNSSFDLLWPILISLLFSSLRGLIDENPESLKLVQLVKNIKNKKNQKKINHILKKADDIMSMTLEEYEIYIDDYTKKSKYPDISKWVN